MKQLAEFVKRRRKEVNLTQEEFADCSGIALTGKCSTIIASQLPVEAWHEIIEEQTIADAILDRLVHTAHRIDIKGESMRKKLKNNH
ncbi:ATP-binding protein [Formosa sp. PL04]|nr:ATP-binding protein [Formosa sp. PL04]MDW5289178.1 ATP-binding protein [Formosa sp. PL04]